MSTIAIKELNNMTLNSDFQSSREDNFTGINGTQLTSKELALIAIFVKYGASNKLLASTFDNSIQTIKNQVKSIFDRLGLSNRSSMAIYYYANSNLWVGIESNPYYISAMAKINAEDRIESVIPTRPDEVNQTASDKPQLVGQIAIVKRESK